GIDRSPAEPTRLDSNRLVTGCRANAARWLRTSIPRPREPLPRGSASLEQRKHLRVRTISVARTRHLAARTGVFAYPTQYRAHDGLARIKFTGGRRVIGCSHRHNLTLMIGKGEEQNSCAGLQVWICVRRNFYQRFRTKHLACDGTAGSRV